LAVRIKLLSPSNFAAVPNGVPSSFKKLLSQLPSEDDACFKHESSHFFGTLADARLSSPEAAEVLQLGNVTIAVHPAAVHPRKSISFPGKCASTAGDPTVAINKTGQLTGSGGSAALGDCGQLPYLRC
jgi:hypothetical protein